MEQLCASLTGFFLWLLVQHCSSSARNRAIQRAGQLLLKVKLPYKSIVYYLTMLLLPCLPIVWGIYRFLTISMPLSIHSLIFLWIDLMLFVLVFWLLTSITIVRRMMAFEIRELGIIHKSVFVAWENIQYCKWNSSKIKIVFKCRHRVLKNKCSVNAFDTATAILSRFVEVRDHTDKVIAGPSQNPQQLKTNDTSTRGIKRFFHFQFDLSSLLLFTLVVASFFCWIGSIYRYSRQQETAIAKLDRYRPAILRIGFDVIILDFANSESKPVDNDLINLKSLPQIQCLYLTGAPITDAGLINLETLLLLQTLSLGGTRITDNGLMHLKSLSQLRDLDLMNTGITDAGLEHLKDMKNLRMIYLSSSKVTPEGVDRLRQAMPRVLIVYPPSLATPY
jgi:hypothetical protein